MPRYQVAYIHPQSQTVPVAWSKAAPAAKDSENALSEAAAVVPKKHDPVQCDTQELHMFASNDCRPGGLDGAVDSVMDPLGEG